MDGPPIEEASKRALAHAPDMTDSHDASLDFGWRPVTHPTPAVAGRKEFAVYHGDLMQYVGKGLTRIGRPIPRPPTS